MVLEQLLPARVIEKKTFYAFFIGVFYAIIGIVIAKILFPADPSLVAVAFTSILLLPLLRKLFTIEEKQQLHEKSFSLKHLFKDEGDFIKVYLLLATGIFATYCFASMILPSFEVNLLFREQLELRGLTGYAFFPQGLLGAILLNNFWVLLACVALSFLTEDGAIFLITWNASLWGTIFGITAKTAAEFAHVNAWSYLGLVLLIVLPHAIIEMLSYISGGVAGGLLSVYYRHPNKKKQRIFYSYTGTILLIALILLIVGAILETTVLANASIYETIVSQSYRL